MAVRYEPLEPLGIRLSYEWTTRLPSPEELFGDGLFVTSSPSLKAERSHNLNLGIQLNGQRTANGILDVDVTGYLRRPSQLMIQRPTGPVFWQYQNVREARILGLSLAASWEEFGQYIEIGGTLTYDDNRNISPEGIFAPVNGDRIPNKPWFFGNAFVNLTTAELLGAEHILELRWDLSYTHRFSRTWESQGSSASQQYIPAQLSNSLRLMWRGFSDRVIVTASARNLGNRALYDRFGVQKPGRSFALNLQTRW